MKKIVTLLVSILILGCQNSTSEKQHPAKEEKILGKWEYQSHKIDESKPEAVKFQKEKMRGVKSLSFTFYEDETYFTRSEVFDDVYSHSGTYRFEDDNIILHSNSENIDRTSRIVTLQKDLLIFEDEIGVELTMDRGKK